MNKQNKTKFFAKALAEIIFEGPASAEASAWRRKVVDNFAKLLINAGYEKKASDILELAENLLLQKHGKKSITFETARATTANQKKLLEKFVNKGDVIKEKINPELIAGIKIVINGSQQFDASLQSKLQNIIK